MNRCDANCVWYPIESFKTEWHYEGVVKHADKLPHICIENGKEIKHHRLCSKYKKIAKIYNLLDNNDNNMI